MNRFSHLLGIFAFTTAACSNPAQADLPRAGSQSRPHLSYSSFLGGENNSRGIASDAQGNLYLAGYTHAGILTNEYGAFVMKYNPASNAVVYVRVIPGAEARGIAVDAPGNVYLTGFCSDSFVPINGAQDTYGGGQNDAFVAKLDVNGSLVYATCLGGNDLDLGKAVVIDKAGNAYISGTTRSTNFPTTVGVVKSRLAGDYDAFVAKLNATGTKWEYVTCLGGPDEEISNALAVDEGGRVVVAGRTRSTSFSGAPAAAQLGIGARPDAFVARLNAQGGAYEYLTFLGGDDEESVAAVVLDSAGAAWLFGHTASTNYPVTAGCLQPVSGGYYDGFVTHLSASGNTLIYSTYLGGNGNEILTELFYTERGYLHLENGGLALDNSGNVYVAGATESEVMGFTITPANTFGGYSDAYLAKLNPATSELLYWFYLGGLSWDGAQALAVTDSGGAWVTGVASPASRPPYFPSTPGAWQTNPRWSYMDGFWARIDETPGVAANDPFASRARVQGSRMTVLADNRSATKEAGEPAHAGNNGGKSLWWSWTAQTNGMLTVTTLRSTFDTLLGVYTGSELGALTLVAGNDNESEDSTTSRVRFPAVMGQTYQIAVDGREGQSGMISLSLTLSVPVNDDFTNRITVTHFPATVRGNNIDATPEPEENLWDHSVWWTWTSPRSDKITISTEESDFDTILVVYTGDSLASLQSVAEGNGLVNFIATAGATYQIAVDASYEAQGHILLTIRPANPPPNDNFTNSAPLIGSLIHVITNNSSATREPDDPDLGFTYPAGATVWWSWQAPTNGWVTITTIGSTFDTQLGVFTGHELSNLTFVAGSDDLAIPGENYYASRVVFQARAGVTYRIVVDGRQGSDWGDIHLRLRLYDPPVILSQTVAGRLEFRVKGVSGRQYAIQASTNLVEWVTVSPEDLSGDSFFFRDPEAVTLSRRFYRVIEPATVP